MKQGTLGKFFGSKEAPSPAASKPGKAGSKARPGEAGSPSPTVLKKSAKGSDKKRAREARAPSVPFCKTKGPQRTLSSCGPRWD